MKWKVYVAGNFNCSVENEGLLKVTDSHVHDDSFLFQLTKKGTVVCKLLE